MQLFNPVGLVRGQIEKKGRKNKKIYIPCDRALPVPQRFNMKMTETPVKRLNYI